MTIWILAVLLLASLAALGFRQGAIRVGFSFLGIVIGALLAAPLGRLAIKPALVAGGVKNPLLVWVVPAFVMFVIILTLFKIAGLAMHKKAEVHYKYKAGDLRLALWERLNHRLGLCLGLLNGIAYFVLISVAIYMLSYWTYQMATPASDPTPVRIVNQLGKDLESTGMSKVAGAVDKNSPAFYDAADIVGLIYHNESVQGRLSRYPGFLALAQRPEFEALGADADFAALRKKQASLAELINHAKTQAILKNPELIKAVQAALVPNLQDLRLFLETGNSTNFTEKILGRWNFDANSAIAMLVRNKPGITPNDKATRRRWMVLAFARTHFIAAPEQQAYLKGIPPAAIGAPPANEPATFTGPWKGQDGKYEVTFSVNGRNLTTTAEITGDRLTIAGAPTELAFIREQ